MIDHPAAYRSAKRGTLVAEALTAPDRARLFLELLGAGMDADDIARHTATSLYTVDRVLREHARGPGRAYRKATA